MVREDAPPRPVICDEGLERKAVGQLIGNDVLRDQLLIPERTRKKITVRVKITPDTGDGPSPSSLRGEGKTPRTWAEQLYRYYVRTSCKPCDSDGKEITYPAPGRERTGTTA